MPQLQGRIGHAGVQRPGRLIGRQPAIAVALLLQRMAQLYPDAGQFRRPIHNPAIMLCGAGPITTITRGIAFGQRVRNLAGEAVRLRHQPSARQPAKGVQVHRRPLREHAAA